MQNLGKHIREIRENKKMTLLELSRQTDIDQATLSRIENNKMVGTLPSHMKIAKALGMSVPDLYRNVFDRESKVEVKTAGRSPDSFTHNQQASSELLTSNILKKKMMPVSVRLKPNGKTQTEELTHGAEKFIYVLKGKVEIRIDKGSHLLRSGESIYFDASLPHSIRNTDKKESQCLSVVTPTTL